MKLSYILGQLASGELSNLHLAADKLTIKPEKLPVVLRRINAALTDLHTRFLINIESVEFEVHDEDIEYEVLPDNFIEITQVYLGGTKLQNGREYRLTRPNRLRLLFSPLSDAVMRIEYKASHKKLTLADVETDVNVNLPESYLNALVYFVASKSYTTVNTVLDGEVSESVTYFRKYQDELLMLANQGVDVDEAPTQDQFSQRGFV